MIRSIRRPRVHLGLAIMLAVFGITPPMRAEVLQNITFDMTIGVNVPCANGGAGELVLLSGQVHEVFAITPDNKGGFQIKAHDNTQGLSGEGLITGDKYRAIVMNNSHTNLQPGVTATTISTFKIIGQGPGANFT